MKVVVIEDNKFWNEKIVSIAKEVLKENNIDIEVISDTRFSDKIEKIMYDNSVKIYIIDSNLPKTTGYEISNLIRYAKEDWESVIILVSIHNYKEEIFSARLSILTYISKKNNFEKNLSESISVSLNIILKQKQIEIKEGNCVYKLFLKNILYIEKEKNSKYCKIMTLNRTFRVRNSLKELKKETDFVQKKKYLLINQNNVIKEDNEEIIFIDHYKKIIR